MLKNRILVSLILLGFLSFLKLDVTAQKVYNHVFNPMRGIVHESEKPMREELCLNGKWQFMPVFDDDIDQFKKPQNFNWDAVPLKVPSPWNINSFAAGDGGDFLTFPSYPKAWEKAKIGWMKKDFVLPDNWSGKQIKLHFEAIAGFAKIYVNGKLAGENLDIFFPTELDVTSHLKSGKNEILVGVAKASLTDDQGKYGRRNYVAGSFWGQHIVGIWQDVSLVAIPQLCITNVFVTPDVASDKLEFTVNIQNNTTKDRSIQLSASIREWYKGASNDVNLAPVDNGILKDEVFYIESENKTIVKAGENATLTIYGKVNDKLNYWTPEAPNLYGSIISLKTGKKKIGDVKYTRFGWRQFSINGTELHLNGKPIVLKGDSWHFMGISQMTRRYAWGWYKMLKDANANAVRLHAQPYPSFYLDMADEMGICVLDETGIWSSDGGPKMDSDDYWEYCKAHVQSLVLRDRNHPAVFGWSVCNETLPVAIHVFHAPESIVQRQVDEINNWVAIVKESDPTRDWISGDGEDMRPTDLPTVIGHYGDESSMKKWSSEGKPWGVGETGMGYYGTPKQISAVNGNRAFESQLGRMEGLATEAYDLIGKQLRYKASYASVFNVIWYGLKPLAFGLSDISRAPKPEDGVFFPEYQEGIPGVQPERLGPYTSTLNPGYDSSLPLYEPWPMFKAIQAINATPAKPFKIEEKNTIAPSKPASVKIKQVGIVSGDKSDLKAHLTNLGVPFVELDNAKNQTIDMLIIDGETTEITPGIQMLTHNCLKSGGKVLVWGVSPKVTDGLNAILPFQLKLTEREASSFLVKVPDELLAGLGNKDLYFTELTRQPVMKYGLSGELVRRGTVILEACNTDWSRWNGQAEYLKTASVYRSERESKPDGAAIVKVASGKGQVYINSIDLLKLKSEGEELVKTLLTNLGIELKDVPVNSLKALSENGILERTFLFTGSELADLGKVENQKFVEDYEIATHPEVVQSNVQDEFNFGRMKQLALSFWVFSPRSLVNLLVEPDMPTLDMVIGGEQEAKVFINGSLFSEKAALDATNELENLPFEKGWNHILIHMKQPNVDRSWKTRIQLESNKREFLNQLKSSVGQ